MIRLAGRLLRKRRAGEASLTWNRPELVAPQTIELTSHDFVHGGAMPQRTAGKGVGDNISPELEWEGAPPATVELVLMIEDPDVPLRQPIVHLSLAGIPPRIASIAEGALNEGAGALGTGLGSFDRIGYQGPRPIKGHGSHSYVFQLYALDAALGLPAGSKPEEIVAAMAGRVIARGRLDGTYER
jgi:hypothetical protein